MSQAKVDRYKEEKANRKKVMRKEKIAEHTSQVCGGSCSSSACCVDWIFCLQYV